jgi:hypothetical protein
VDVGPPFVAHRKPAVTGQPRQSTFHHPPVPAKPLAGVLTPPGDARLDAAVGQRLSATGEVVSLVGVQLRGALSWSTPARERGLSGAFSGADAGVAQATSSVEDLAITDGDRTPNHRHRPAD